MNKVNITQIFACTQCGGCCQGETTVSLDHQDQQRMIDFFGAPRDTVADQYWRMSGSVIQMKIIDHHCIFYRNGCTVYEGRPWRCRQWPLVPAILLDEANFSAISESCPGINRSLSYTDFCEVLREILGSHTLSGTPTDED